jgi:hypothetical protein
MQPEIDFQLSVVLNTLQKVVLPAVDVNNKPVQEQLHLAIRTVEGVLERIPYRRRFIREELKLLLDLANSFFDVFQSEAEPSITSIKLTVQKGEKAYRDADVDTEQLAGLSARLSSEITDLLQGSRSSTAYKPLSTLVVQHSKALINLSRAWCSDNGLEPDFDLDILASQT